MPVPAVAELLDFVLRLIDRVVSPETRQNVSQRVREFAAARPLLFSFIVTQATFSAMPIFFFVLASIFSILTIVSTALIFLVLFWTGFAITIIAPILLISSAFALFFWAFGVVLFTVGSSALALVATADSTSDAPSGGNDKQRPRLPAATPSSSSATSWVKSEGRDIKKEETSGTDKLASVHPAPGSDVDALEP